MLVAAVARSSLLSRFRYCLVRDRQYAGGDVVGCSVAVGDRSMYISGSVVISNCPLNRVMVSPAVARCITAIPVNADAGGDVGDRSAGGDVHCIG